MGSTEVLLAVTGPASALVTVFGTKWFDNRREDTRWLRESKAAEAAAKASSEAERRTALTDELARFGEFLAWMRRTVMAGKGAVTTSARAALMDMAAAEFKRGGASLARIGVMAPTLAQETQTIFGLALDAFYEMQRVGPAHPTQSPVLDHFIDGYNAYLEEFVNMTNGFV